MGYRERGDGLTLLLTLKNPPGRSNQRWQLFPLHKIILSLSPTMARQHCWVCTDKKVEQKDIFVSFPSFLISDGRAWTVSVAGVCFWAVLVKSYFLQLLLCALPSFSSCCHVSVWGLLVEQFFLFSLTHPGRFCVSFMCFVFIFSLPEHVALCLFRLTLPSEKGIKNTKFQNKSKIYDPFKPIFLIKNLFYFRNFASSPVCTLHFWVLSALH